jgi:hypothetical protein
MFPVCVNSLVSLNETKDYHNSPFHAVAYMTKLTAGMTGRVVGISAHDPDTFYIRTYGRGHIIVARRADFTVVKE